MSMHVDITSEWRLESPYNSKKEGLCGIIETLAGYASTTK